MITGRTPWERSTGSQKKGLRASSETLNLIELVQALAQFTTDKAERRKCPAEHHRGCTDIGHA